MFNLNNVAGFAIFGAILAGWNQIKGFLYTIISFFIRTDTLESDILCRRVLEGILPKSKIIRWGNTDIGYGAYNYIKKYKVFSEIFYRKETSIILLYNKYSPVIIRFKNGNLSFTYLWGTFNFRPIIEEAYSQYLNSRIENSLNDNRHYIQYHSGRDSFSSNAFQEVPSGHSKSSGELRESTGNNKQESQPVPFFWIKEKADILGLNYEDIQFDGELDYKNAPYYWSASALKLLEEVKYWSENSKWFSERNIVHRRGVLLYGPPGGGKSKMILEVAKKLGIPISSLNISNMTNNEFVSFYSSNGENKMIILIEDIDTIFNGRKNLLAESSLSKNLLSFDTLINTISGVKENQGIFLIVTTNEIEKLDSALLRPGRCDVHIKVDYLDQKGKETIAQNILFGYPDLIEKYGNMKEDQTAAAFENLCIEAALKRFYENKSLTSNAQSNKFIE